MEATHAAVIKAYKEELERKALKVVRVFEATDSTPALSLGCWQIDPQNKPKGFLGSTTRENLERGSLQKYQYRVDGTKMTAWHIPFLNSRRDPSQDSQWTLSHLCHNPSCYNWNHHTVEPLTVNKGRNGCAGGSKCAHTRTPCLIRGPNIE